MTDHAGVTTATLDEASVLDEAQGIVNGSHPTHHKYGPPWKDLGETGRVWAAILSRHFDQRIPDIPADMVAVMMAGLKAIREAGNHHDDNVVDGVGWWLCVQQVVAHRGAGKDFDSSGSAEPT